MTTRVTFVGTADAFNSGARGHSCYRVDDALGSYMVDFGPTALQQCKRLGADPTELDAVFLTHLHGDHIGGLPVLLIDQQFRGLRERALVIAGPAGAADRVAALQAASYPGVAAHGLSFPLQFRQWRVPGEVEVLGRRVRAIPALHSPEAEPTSLRIENGETALVFSGDTGWQPELWDLARGADLFVCECSFAEASYEGHLSLDMLAERRDTLQVDRLVLSHLSDASRAAGDRIAALDAEAADDGLIIELGAPPRPPPPPTP